MNSALDFYKSNRATELKAAFTFEIGFCFSNPISLFSG